MNKPVLVSALALSLLAAATPFAAANGGGFNLCFSSSWSCGTGCGTGCAPCCGPCFPCVDPALFGLPNGQGIGGGYYGYPYPIYAPAPVYPSAPPAAQTPASAPASQSYYNYGGYPTAGYYYPGYSTAGYSYPTPSYYSAPNYFGYGY